MADDLTLVVAGRQISGWTKIQVGRGIERLPSDFSVELTELFPGQANDYVVQPGDSCQVLLGQDLVLTGYIDRFVPSITAGEHLITVAGRGKCADLVDCAAIWQGGQISNADVLSIATKLAAPYGISVQSLSGQGLIVSQYNMQWGATVFEIIEMLCRWSGFLAYDGPDGNLILSQAGTTKHASGFAQGVNVQTASIVYSMDQRYSQYVVRRLATDTLSDLGEGGDVLQTFQDAGVPRPRVRYIIVETGDQGIIAQKRGAWECGRRFGRSAQLRLVTDGWRDSAGQLWTPNQLVDVSLPIIKTDAKTWIISEVSFMRDAQGTRAELVIMPPQAFQPQPVLLPWEMGLQDVPAFAGVPAR